MATMGSLLLLFLTTLMPSASALQQLLSDLPTPSLVMDMQSLQRQLPPNAPIAPILLKNNHVLVPRPESELLHWDLDASPVPALDSGIPICFLHSTVVRAREDSSEPSFLADLDLKFPGAAKLVLGLNNHHVMGYYWARSAGAGAAMDAPGVFCDTDRGKLRWLSSNGPADCNSNDGKRSEWVNFLRNGDNVQLLPTDSEEEAILAFAGERIFGVSSQGRPLGSEPMVVCSWKLEERCDE